ncbi:MAG: hypothetical protein H6738_24630 [Alphaproteobacteria bacterium]|nr:hypothetical protein [Alphaproteobacteria bacterium]MCB9699997.1 hypothetical protein [Alphaproteobacteria bacterium]
MWSVALAIAVSCSPSHPTVETEFPIQSVFVQNDDLPIDLAFIVRFDAGTAAARTALAERLPTLWEDVRDVRATVVHSTLDPTGEPLVVGEPVVLDLTDSEARSALAARLVSTAPTPGPEEGLDVGLAVDETLFAVTEGRRQVLFFLTDTAYEGTRTADDFVQDLTAARPLSPLVTSIVGGARCGDPPELDYVRAASELDGSVEDLCSGDWDEVVTRLGAQAAGQRTTFALRPGVPDPETISVRVDDEVRGDWSYDAATWSVTLREPPPPASVIVIDHTAVPQLP